MGPAPRPLPGSPRVPYFFTRILINKPLCEVLPCGTEVEALPPACLQGPLQQSSPESLSMVPGEQRQGPWARPCLCTLATVSQARTHLN